MIIHRGLLHFLHLTPTNCNEWRSLLLIMILKVNFLGFWIFININYICIFNDFLKCHFHLLYRIIFKMISFKVGINCCSDELIWELICLILFEELAFVQHQNQNYTKQFEWCFIANVSPKLLVFIFVTWCS